MARAGLSAGAFYHYFGSKEELIAAVGDHIADLEIGVAGGRVASATTPGVGLAALAARLFGRPKSFTSLLPIARAQAAHQPAIRESLSRYDHRMIAAVGALGEEAKQQGDLRDDIDPEALTELGLIVYEGFQARGQSQTFTTSYERVARTFLQLLALGAAPSGSRYRATLRDAIDSG